MSAPSILYLKMNRARLDMRLAVPCHVTPRRDLPIHAAPTPVVFGPGASSRAPPRLVMAR